MCITSMARKFGFVTQKYESKILDKITYFCYSLGIQEWPLAALNTNHLQRFLH